LAYESMNEGPKSKKHYDINNNFTITIPTNFGFDNIESDIQSTFDIAKQKIINNGINVVEVNLPILDRYKKVPLWQFAAVECQTEYFDAYRDTPELIDPNILKRMHRANDVKAVEYNLLLKVRQKMIEMFNNELGDGFLLMPTVTIKPPLLKDCNDTKHYDEVNLISLQNTTLANFMNGCSISIPFSNNNTTMGIMLNGSTNMDYQLLEIGAIIEKILK
jgi:aspartyl-tRNA(Asn)/glutamyl-tRNA(Gln) amidotransferase subunit A